jgi:hypothetical protein
MVGGLSWVASSRSIPALLELLRGLTSARARNERSSLELQKLLVRNQVQPCRRGSWRRYKET